METEYLSLSLNRLSLPLNNNEVLNDKTSNGPKNRDNSSSIQVIFFSFLIFDLISSHLLFKYHPTRYCNACASICVAALKICGAYN